MFAVWKLKQVKLEIYTACLMLGGLNLNGCGLILGLVHLLINSEVQTEIVCWGPVGLFHNLSQCGQQYCGSSLCHDLYSQLTLILRRSRTGTVWFYTSTSNKRAARPKLYTKSLTRDLKRIYSPFTLVRISINL